MTYLFPELEWSWLNFVVTWLKIFRPNDSTKKLSQVTGNQNSLVFTRSVSSNMLHVPEARTQVSRQSLKYRGTVLLNHLLKTKLLHRNYESISENETKRLILKIKNKISSERLADIVFC